MIAWKTIAAGNRALVLVPGLKKAVWRAMFINFIVIGLLAFVLHWLCSRYLLDPALNWIFGNDNDWIATTGRILGWILQWIIAALLIIVSMNISLSLMGIWYENLVEKVVSHLGNRVSHPFTWRTFLQTQRSSIWVAIQDIVMSLGLLPLGFIPVVGFFIVVLGGSFLTGRSVIAAYEAVTISPGESLSKVVSQQGAQAIALCWPIALLAFVPVIGWFLAPWLLAKQVVGWAFLKEQASKTG